MALVNPNIAMGFRQPDIQAPNALAQFAQIQQIQGGRQAQELNALKMQEAQAAMEERNALRQLNPAEADYENQLFKVNPTLGIQYRKERTAAEASGAAALASKASAQSSQATAAATKKKLAAQALRDISSRPSDANITAHMEDVLESDLFNEQEKAEVTRYTARLLSIPLAERGAYLANQGASAAELRPQVVAPGASLVQGSKAVYTAPFAPEKPPALTNLAKLQNELAALPPGDPRRAQYEALIRKEITPVAGTNITMVSEKAEQAARGARLDKQYDDISKAAGLASKTLPAIEANLSALNKGFDTGFGKETVAAGASVLAALGVKDAAKFATDTQMFQSNAISAVLQKQLEQKGPQTESDAKRIEQIGAQLGKTKDANRFILDTAKEQLRRDMDQRNFYDRWYEANKTYNGAENAWFNGEGGKSLFDRPSLKKYNVSAADAAAQIPGNRPAPAAAPASAIPQGAIDRLKAGGGTDAQFDAIFGPGAAKRARGGK